MTLELKKSMILNKLNSINTEIIEKKANIVVAYKLSFELSGQAIEKELSLLIDFRNWLEELEADKL